jgi:RNA polymerase subunit RPABC4/transcription elongation factor Spt4
MSKMTPHELQCPHCGNKQKTMVWDSINVTLDPDLKKRLYAAEINLFECEKCGKKTFINAPLLYHDMRLQFFIQYYPPDSLDDIDFFHQFKKDGSLSTAGIPEAIAKSASYLTRPHIVFDMNEMIRYVAFRDGITGAKEG